MQDRKRPRYNNPPAFEEKEGRDLLTHLRTDLLRHIGSFFSAKKQVGDSKTLAGLARTSQRFHTLFQPDAQAAVDKILFNHIVCGEPNEVYAMLDKRPSLLLHTSTVTDLAGYTITATPYRAALCCQDPQMAEEIQRRLIAYAGPEEAARQWAAQFPLNWKEDEAERWRPVFTQLDKLDAVIQAAEEKDMSSDHYFKVEVREGSVVETELKEFQRLLDATRDKPIETGRTFNLIFLHELANRYDRYCSNFGANNPKSLLFWQRILGYAQRFLSASDAQAFIAGLYNTKNNLENKIPQGRDFKMHVYSLLSHKWAMCSYYACALGFDYGIYGTRPPCGIMFCPDSVAIGMWDNYYRQKQALFKNLCCDIQVQNKTGLAYQSTSSCTIPTGSPSGSR